MAKKVTILGVLQQMLKVQLDIKTVIEGRAPQAPASIYLKKSGYLELKTSADRFEKLSDGWIKDKVLGLDWGPSSTKTMNWEDAKKYAAEQGGRLPEIDELESLADRSRRNPAINPIFADTKTDDWYWSNTPVVEYSGGAWVVSFGYGYVGNYDKDYRDFVRPVRSSQV
ncbi:MAG: DUF1566 domain-containing protein [Clostridia bacterium]|jgi:hypothetical protein